ncbi:MAG: hypothetical protein ACYCWW_10705 [Deltaproteobacteria bacterium]
MASKAGRRSASVSLPAQGETARARGPRAPLFPLLLALAGCAGSLADPQAFLDAATTSGGAGGTNGGSGTSGGAGSGGTSGGTGRVTCDAPRQVFLLSCAVSGCHLPPNVQGVLALAEPDGGPISAADLMAGAPAFCNSIPYVVPGHPEQSFLWTMVNQNPTCNGINPFSLKQMPLNTQSLNPVPLSQSDEQCVEDWILGLDGGGG